MLTVYAAWRNSDMTEGKGPMVMDKVFFEEAIAQEYINLQSGVFGRTAEHGWQNSDMGDWTVKPLHILESLEDGEELVKRQTLERAYSKLNKVERAAIEEDIRATLSE